MDNPATKDDLRQSNSSLPKGKVLVRMESAVTSITSSQDLIEDSPTTYYSSDSNSGKLNTMLSKISNRILFVVILLLSVGVLVMTALYILSNHKHEKSSENSAAVISIINRPASKQSPDLVAKRINCWEHPSDVVLDSMPPAVKMLLPKIEAQITAQAQLYGVKAGSFGIAYNGKLWWTFHYGQKNFSDPTSRSPNGDTPYPVASLTKIVTAVMLMKMIELGLIKSIDDPVSKYEPRFKVKNPFNKEQITFRQLICMKSGLPREAPCHPAEKLNFCPHNTTDMWRRISQIELPVRPNKAQTYSNLGYAVLGRAMENLLNGTSYEDWIDKEILDKLDMKGSGFSIGQKLNQIPVSTNIDKTRALLTDWGWLRPAAGVYMTLNDLHKLSNALMETLNTTLIKTSSKRQIFTKGCPMKLWQQQTVEVDDKNKKISLQQNFHSANGLTLGYCADYGVSPEMRIATYALMAYGRDYQPVLGILAHKFRNMVLRTVANVLRRKEEKYKVPPNMDAYIGTYKTATYFPLINKNLVISKRNGRLHVQFDWYDVDLTYIGPWHLKTVATTKCKYMAYSEAGLLNNNYHFLEPTAGTNKCPGFYVDAISPMGYMSFTRI